MYDRSKKTSDRNFPVTVKKPIGSQLRINITALSMSTITLAFSWAPTNHETLIRQPLRHLTTLPMRTLSPISTLTKQRPNLEQAYIRCSLPCDRWTVEVRNCASTLNFFPKNVPERRLNKTVATSFELGDLWKPEARTEFQRLWWTVAVVKCTCLF